MTDYDVAIVGYGPTGMVLAGLLGQLGRKVLIVERYEGLYNLPRAAGFDDEAMRTFQKLGITEALKPGIRTQDGYEWLNQDGETLVSIEYENPAPNGWSQQYMMYQPHMEDVLDRHVTSLETVHVRKGINIDTLVQDDERVRLIGTGTDGAQHTFQARYVVGADGANGMVRAHMDGEIDDYGFFENWLVCDFKMLREDHGVPMFQQVCSPEQPTSIVNIGPGYHRFSFALTAEDERSDVTQPEKVWARVAKYMGQDVAELIRVANYTFRSKIVKEWRDGRILLAGDAAHEMPPFLAQGMVSGIRDSRNLAWKLDLVLSGHSDTLLDTYQIEREPHVRFITEKAIELGRVQTMRDAEKARERDVRMLAARKADQKPSKIRYPPLSGGLVAGYGDVFPQGHVNDGKRTALFDDIVGTDWTILTRDPAMLEALDGDQKQAFEALGGRIVTVGAEGSEALLVDDDGVLTRWFDTVEANAVLVRPDRYVFGLAESAEDLASLVDKLHAMLAQPAAA